MAAMSLYAYFYCKKRNYKTLERPDFKGIVEVLRESFWALCLPLLIFGGINSGMFTAN
jgi:C4-dicarboxylate transporter DctM subunit